MMQKVCILLLILFMGCTNDESSSLENVLSHARLPYLKDSRLFQISSYDTTGGNNDRINIHKDKTVTIADLDGPGVITRIWITIDSRDPHFLRRIVLRIYWDEESTPSVEVPVGDFFGTGFQYKHYNSQYLGMSSGGYYCYFPMPFNKHARVEIANETGQEIYAFYYHIDYQKLSKPLDDKVAYFHSRWRREVRTEKDKNYTILDIEGEGHFIGCNMSMQAYENSLWYLEGDEMVYVDGEKFPSIYGTGTEDYFTSGWYFKDGEFAAPFHGLIIKDEKLARIAAYRHHIPDPIPFKKSIKFTIEHSHNNEEVCDYSSTAYWYQKEPHQEFTPILKSSLRIPLREIVPNGLVEAENLTPTHTAITHTVMDMSDFGAEWSNLKQLKFNADEKGGNFTLTIPDYQEKAYNVDIYFTKGPNYGNASIYYEDRKVGELKSYNGIVYPGGKISLKNLRNRDGNLPIKFILNGKDPNSSGYEIGIDGFKVEPVREYISVWNLIGPFPNPRDSDILRYGLDTVYPPEKEINLEKTYEGAAGQIVGWQKIKTPKDGYISLWKKMTPYEFVVTYAQTYIYSPLEQSIPLFIGSDDGCKVFLNGEELHRFLDVRISAPDQDNVTLSLKKGWNSLLLKIENNFGGYAFYARVLDFNDNLRFSLSR